MTLPTGAAIRLTVAAAARNPDLAGVRGKVTEDAGGGWVSALFGGIHCYFKTEDVECVDA